MTTIGKVHGIQEYRPFTTYTSNKIANEILGRRSPTRGRSKQ